MNAAQIEAAVLQSGLDGISAEAAERFAAYLSLLLKWNSRLNLTAIRDPEAMVRRHFVECIQCAQSLPEVSTLLDFGSGAGLPGIPIAICRSEIRVTLAESQRKKAAFLRETVRELGLNAEIPRVEVLDGRVEEMPAGTAFEAVALRAVDKMAQACRTAQTRLAASGWMVLFSTDAGSPALKADLPGILWQREIPTQGLDRGIILLGQKTPGAKLFHVEHS